MRGRGMIAVNGMSRLFRGFCGSAQYRGSPFGYHTRRFTGAMHCRPVGSRCQWCSGPGEPARFVEFECKGDLCIPEQGERSIHHFTARVPELLNCRIATGIPEFDQDKFPLQKNECAAQGM